MVRLSKSLGNVTIWNLLGKNQPAKSHFVSTAEKIHPPTSHAPFASLPWLPCCLPSARWPPPQACLPAPLHHLNRPGCGLSLCWLRLGKLLNDWVLGSCSEVTIAGKVLFLGIYILAEIAIINVKLLLMVERHSAESDLKGRCFASEQCSVSCKFHDWAGRWQCVFSLLGAPGCQGPLAAFALPLLQPVHHWWWLWDACPSSEVAALSIVYHMLLCSTVLAKMYEMGQLCHPLLVSCFLQSKSVKNGHKVILYSEKINIKRE